MNDRKKLESLVKRLLAWYEKNKRALPWRNEPSPYHVWISEIMLQQTRIEAVIPYYERFLQELPDIAALASVSDDRLMKLWEGLGYYSRARNLKKAACTVMEKYDGQLPDTAEELRRLSGIGDYTAGAIASISFGRPEPAVDGNVLRVIMRYLGKTDDIALQATKKETAASLRAVYPSGESAKNLTQAIMELGESVCIPNGQPKCGICPLSAFCSAKAENLTDSIPFKSPKKPRKQEPKTVFLLSCRGNYAICQRPETGLLAKLWEFPNAQGKLSEEEAIRHLSSLDLSPVGITPCGDAVHIFTHIEWHMTGYAAECLYPSERFVWKSAEEILSDYAIPSAFRAYVSCIKKEQKGL
ncbi:MAG: A/G-specific adenine glycosylase [Ruminococcaceae bacterium]|nr:A/G-specific adenine glycosylase [Oscillospiraceae bacterium]